MEQNPKLQEFDRIVKRVGEYLFRYMDTFQLMNEGDEIKTIMREGMTTVEIRVWRINSHDGVTFTLMYELELISTSHEPGPSYLKYKEEAPWIQTIQAQLAEKLGVFFDPNPYEEPKGKKIWVWDYHGYWFQATVVDGRIRSSDDPEVDQGEGMEYCILVTLRNPAVSDFWVWFDEEELRWEVMDGFC